jgi:transposase
MELHTIGIDLGKTVFHLVGLNQRGEVVVRKKFSRKQLLHFTANLQVHLIGMEACGGSHFLGRALREQGHEARLMPAQYVKPYVKTNKSDFIDAEAIAAANSLDERWKPPADLIAKNLRLFGRSTRRCGSQC